MVTFHPYSPPVDLPQEKCVRLTQHEELLQKTCWSLSCAVLSCVSLVSMVYLMECHDTGESSDLADGFPFSKVVISLGMAAVAASLAFLFSIPVFLSGRILPTVWLVPLVVVIFCFFICYDWFGLFEFGKPRYKVWPRSVNFAWVVLRYGGSQMLLVGFGLLALFKCMRWIDRRITARDAENIGQIIAAEIAAHSEAEKNEMK